MMQQRRNAQTNYVEQSMSVQQSQDAVQPTVKQPVLQQQGHSAPAEQQSAGTAAPVRPQIRDWASI